MCHLELILLSPLLDHQLQLSRALDAFAPTAHFKPFPQVCSLEGKPSSMCVHIALGFGRWTEIGPAATHVNMRALLEEDKARKGKEGGPAFICSLAQVLVPASRHTMNCLHQ